MSEKSIPVERQPLPLADVAEIVSGYGFPKDMQGKTVGELPFFKVGDISAAWNSGQKKLIQAQHYLDNAEASAIKAKPFPKGTVVFAKIGEAIKLNRRAILGQLSIVDNNVMGLIPKEGVVEQNYLFYWTLMLRLGDISQATTVPSVRKSDVEQLSFPWVPLDQQKRIVAEIEKQFSRLDEAVANLKRVKANLKRYKAAVLKAAVEGRLVETEAERARREGRSYETGAQLLQRILETRRSQWQGKGKYKDPAAPDTTDLPELPEGWVWASVEQLTSDSLIGLDRGRDQQNADGIGVPYVKMNNVTMDGEVTGDGIVYVDASDEEKRRFNLKIDDLLFNTRNSKELVGKVGIVHTLPKEAIYNNNLMRLRMIDGTHPSFICTQMCSSGFRRRMELVKKATTNVAAVYAKDLFPLPIALPPVTEQHRIVSEVDRRLSVLRETEAQVDVNLQRAERLRQSILSSAFGMTLQPN